MISGNEDKYPSFVVPPRVDSEKLHISACENTMRYVIVTMGGQYLVKYYMF